MVLDWNEHCDQVVSFGTFSTGPPHAVHDLLKEVIDQLMSINTCFIVETSENRIHTTKRGADHLQRTLQL